VRGRQAAVDERSSGRGRARRRGRRGTPGVRRTRGSRARLARKRPPRLDAMRGRTEAGRGKGQPGAIMAIGSGGAGGLHQPAPPHGAPRAAPAPAGAPVRRHVLMSMVLLPSQVVPGGPRGRIPMAGCGLSARSAPVAGAATPPAPVSPTPQRLPDLVRGTGVPAGPPQTPSPPDREGIQSP